MACTIKDISKDTGLSIATISKYLNGKKISRENQVQIDASIQKLGYVPNKTAQTLRSRKTNTICVLIPDAGDYFWGLLCSYIEDLLFKHHFSTIIRSYSPKVKDCSDELLFLTSNQISGVLFVPGDTESYKLAELMRNANIPFVYLDQIFDSPHSDGVSSCNYQASFDAMNYLYSQGHRQIGIISGDPKRYAVSERIRGCLDACHSNGFQETDLLFLHGDFSRESGAELFHQAISHKVRPSAIFVLGSNLTLGGILELNNSELKLPEELSLISFDDDYIFSAFNPPITCIEQDFSQIAYEGVNLLLRRLNNDYEGFPEKRLIPTRFIERESVLPRQ